MCYNLARGTALVFQCVLPALLCAVCAIMQVADVLVASLRQPSAANKVVEIVSSPNGPELPETDWFAV